MIYGRHLCFTVLGPAAVWPVPESREFSQGSGLPEEVFAAVDWRVP